MQLLIYPAVDAAMDTRSFRDAAQGYHLERQGMIWFWGHYLGDADPTAPDASPLRAADLSGLPPAHVITAEYDPLRDEAEAYAERLREAGVAVTLRDYEGMVHGFFRWRADVDAAHVLLADTADVLREALSD